MAKQLNVNLAFTADTSQAAAQVRNLQQQLTTLINQPVGLGQKLTADIQEATTAAAELKVHLQNATNVKTGTLDFGKLNQSLKAGGISLSQYAAKLQSIGPQGQQAFMSLARSVANAEVPLRRSNALLQQFGITLANTARWQISSSILHGFMGSIQKAYGYAKDLNESLNNIRIVTGYNIDQMSEFAAQANKAAKALSTTTTQYTNASLIYYQQGLSDAEVKERTDVTIKLANVSRQSAEIVSEQMTAIWNNFDDGSKSLEYYADVVTALGAATASSSEEIAQGLEKFAAVAETVGLSYEYATAALATVTATTRQSADVVGTAFKTLFARIQDLNLGKTLDDGTTLGQYSQALAAVGVSIKDTSGEMKQMDQILEEMAQKWDTLGKDQQVALAQSVAGVRQYTQLIALMNNWDFMQKNLDTANAASGTLNEQAKIYAESWEAASNRARASMENIYKEIMNDEFFISLTNGFTKLTDGVGRFVKSIGGLKGVLTGLGFILTKVFSDQLAQGFSNMAYNMQMSTKTGRQMVQNAKLAEMQAFTQEAYVMENRAGSTMSQVYSEELTMQTMLLKNAKNLTVETKAKLDFLMQAKQTAGDEAIALSQQTEELQNQAILLEAKVRAGGANIDISQSATFRRDMMEIGNIEVLLQGMGSSAQVSQKQIDILGQKLANLNSQGIAIPKLNSSLVNLSGTSAEVVETITNLSTILETIKSQNINNILGTTSLDSTSTQYKTLTNDVTAWGNALTQAGQRQQMTNNKTEQGTQILKQYTQILEDVRTTGMSTSQALAQLTSSIMSFGMLVSSIQGLTDAINSPDLSGWDRVNRVLMSVSMTIMSLTGVYRGLKAIIKLTSAETMKSTVAKLAEAAATKVQTRAEMERKMVNGEPIGPQMTRRSAIKQGWSQGAWGALNDTSKQGYINQAANKAGYRQIQNPSKSNYGMWYNVNNKQNDKKKGGRYHADNLLTTDQLSEQMQPDAAKMAGKDALKANLKSLGTMAIVAAAVTAGFAMVKSATQLYDKESLKAEQLNKAAEKAKQAFSEASQGYQTLMTTVEGYTSAIEGLDKLTEGTEEFKKAITEANDQAWALIETVDNLDYKVNATTGLIEISDAELERAQQESLQKKMDAQALSVAASGAAERQAIEVKKEQFNRNKMKSTDNTEWNGEDTAYTLGGTGVGLATGATIGAFVGSLAGPVGALVGGLIGAAAGGLIGGITSLFAKEETSKEDQALDIIASRYRIEGEKALDQEAMKQALLENGFSEADAEKLAAELNKNGSATRDLIKEMAANTTATRKQNEAMAAQKLAGQYEGENADEIVGAASRSYAIMVERLTEKYNDIKWTSGPFNTATDDAEKLWKKYKEYRMKEDSSVSGFNASNFTKSGYVEYSYYKDGKKEKDMKISQAEIAAYVATQEALEKLGAQANTLASKFQDLSATAEGQAAMVFHSEGSFANAQAKDTEALYKQMRTTKRADGTQNDTEKVTREDVAAWLDDTYGDGKDDKLSKDTLNLLGYSSMDEAITDYYNKITTSYDNINKYTEQTVANQAYNLGATEDVLNKLFTAQRKMTESGIDTSVFDEIITKMVDYGATNEDKLAIYQALAEVDWSSWNAMGDAAAKMAELGYNVDITSESFKTLATRMRDASLAIPDFSTLKNDLTEIIGLLQELEFGNTYSAENYTKIINRLGSAWKKFFILQNDGSYKFIGNYDKVREASRALLEDTTEEYEKIAALRKDIDDSKNFIINDKMLEKAAGGDGDGELSDTQIISFMQKYGDKDSIYYREDIAKAITTAATKENADGVIDGLTSDEVLNIQKVITARDLYANKNVQQFLADKYTEDDLEKIYAEALAGDTTRLDSLIKYINDSMGIDLNSAYQDTQELWASSASSLTDLEQLNQERNFDPETYGKGLLYLASQYDSCAEEVEEYNKVLESYEAGTEEATKAQDKLAKSLKKAEFDEIAKDIYEASKALDGLEDQDEIDKQIRTIQKALFDTFGTTVPLETLKKYKDYFAEWSKASKDEADDIFTMIMSLMSLDEKLNSDKTGFTIKIDDKEVFWSFSEISGGYETVKSIIENNPPIVTATGDADYSQMIKELLALGCTGEEVAHIIAGIGQTDITISGSATDIPANLDLDTEEGLRDFSEYLDKFQANIEAGGTLPGGTIIGTGGGRHSGDINKGGGGNRQKKEKKSSSDEKDRYHVIREEIEDLTKSQEKLSKAKDQAFGKAKLDLMQAEVEVLDDLITKQDEYLAEIDDYLRKDRAKMIVYGAEFDENGVISNYDALLQKELDIYNAAVEKFNKDGNEEAFEAAEERYENFKKDLEQYEETMDLWEDEQAERAEMMREKWDQQFEALTYEIEFKLDIEEDSLKLLDYFLSKIEDDAFAAAEAIGLLGQQTQDAIDKIELNRQGIEGLLGMHNLDMSILDQIQKGEVSLEDLGEYGFSDEEISQLRTYVEGLTDGNTELLELRETIQDKVLEALDAWNEKIDTNIDKMDNLTSIMESYQSIIELVGKSTLKLNDDFLNNLAQEGVNNSVNKLATSVAKYNGLLEEQARAQEALDKARESGSEQDIKLWEKTLQEVGVMVDEAQQGMMDSWNEALESAANAFEQAVANAVDTFEKSMAGAFGNLDGLQEVFDQQAEIAERYLADYAKIYELNKLNRDITNSIDDNDSIKAKRVLRDLQKEINDLQESETELSQYDVDHLRKKYELRLAEIALEEAQNAKSQVRMRRDTEGNWSYVYTADENKVEEARQNYEDKLYEMQELNNEYIHEMQSNILKSEVELANALRELDKVKFASDEEYYAEVARLQGYYLGQHNYYTDELNKALGNNQETYDIDWTNYSNLTGYKISKNEEYADKFNETILSQLTGYQTLEEVQDAFTNHSQAMVEDLKVAYDNWKANYDTIFNTAGTSIDNFANTTASAYEKIATDSQKATEDAQQTAKDMTTAFDDICTAVTTWQETWSTALSEAIKENEKFITSTYNLIKALSELKGTIPETDKPSESTQEDINNAKDELNNSNNNITNADGNGDKDKKSTYRGYDNEGIKDRDLIKAAQRAVGLEEADVDGYWGKKSQDKAAESEYQTTSVTEVLKAMNLLDKDRQPKTVPALESNRALIKLDTGGYTGTWNNTNGRLAMLHQKELVLNEMDTANMLKAVEIVRSIARVIDLNAGSQANGLGYLNATSANNHNQVIEQEVTIHAEFPNATDHNEIEMAFDTLINRASQFANRKNI